jgi:hypothetical protein
MGENAMSKLYASDIENNYQILERCKIGILGVTDDAGISFVAVSLAKALADYGLVPAVVELGKGALYESIGIERRFLGREFYSYFKALHDEEKIRGKTNFDEGINWVLRTPKDAHIALSPHKMLRLISNIAGEVIICDLSGVKIQDDAEDLMTELLKEMDALIAVIDPMPSRMIRGYPHYHLIRRLPGKVIYVINKYNRGINNREMNGFLKVRNPVIIPFVAPEALYEAEYNCSLAYSNSVVKKIIKEPIRELLKRVIPSELIKF